MSNASYKVLVVGGGPGGYVAAIRAAQLGLKTALIEQEHLGGVCLNWGCIPTKALLKSAEVFTSMQQAGEYGVQVENPSFNLDSMVSRSRGIANKLNQGVGYLLKKNKVDVISGSARMIGGGKVVVTASDGTESRYESENIILATGARPRILPGLEVDKERIWSSKEAMIPEELPSSLLVVGAGAIGVEFASFYNALGVPVTIVELDSQILPFEDQEIAALARAAFEKKGIQILTDSKVISTKSGKDAVSVVIDSKGEQTTLVVDRVISAVGVVGNWEKLGVENTRIKVEGSFVVTDCWSQTSEPGVFAIGDLSGPPCLAHKASHEGIICVEKIAGLKNLKPLDKNTVPGCTYSMPQVASVGLTESEAVAKGYKAKVGRFPFAGNGKAMAIGKTDGLVKTVFDSATGELLGAHLVGADVTELIQGFGIAQALETTEHELMTTIFPHPTLSEMMQESVLDAYNKAIHI